MQEYKQPEDLSTNKLFAVARRTFSEFLISLGAELLRKTVLEISSTPIPLPQEIKDILDACHITAIPKQSFGYGIIHNHKLMHYEDRESLGDWADNLFRGMPKADEIALRVIFKGAPEPYLKDGTPLGSLLLSAREEGWWRCMDAWKDADFDSNGMNNITFEHLDLINRMRRDYMGTTKEETLNTEDNHAT